MSGWPLMFIAKAEHAALLSEAFDIAIWPIPQIAKLD
jgi:hypothetical protein